MPSIAELDSGFFSFRTPEWKSRHAAELTFASERAALSAWRAWGLPHAPSLMFDFTKGKSFRDGLLYDATSLLSTTRASAAWADDSAGTWSQFASGAPRITDKGLLVEEARTNLFLNSGTPATQSITVVSGSVYTVSVVGAGSVTLSGAGSGTVSQGSPVTFTAGSTSLTLTTAGITGLFPNVNVELGSFATSPIRTTGTSATRASDRLTTPLIVGQSMSLYVEMMRPSAFPSASEVLVGVGRGSSFGESVYLQINSSNVLAAAPGTSPVNLSIGGATYAAGSISKTALALAANDAALVTGGGVPGTDANCQAPPDTTLLAIGSAPFSSGSSYFNGYIRRVAFWPTRLSNAQLQALTQ